MKSFLLTAGSLTLTATVVGNAFVQKKQFYPSVVYLTKSNPSMAVLYIQAFVLVILAGKIMRKLFFGQLRAAEMEHLIERSWYAVTETCLAFTVFRDNFSSRFVCLFTLLLFLKCFHWLAEDRIDYMERSPVISFLFHMRAISLLLFLGIMDVYFIGHAYQSTLIKGASVQLVFGFEYAILSTVVVTVLVKYILHSIDLNSENPWENKAVYLLYTELVLGFIKVLLYSVFLAIMIKVHTFPLFAVRPMYLTMRTFKKALHDVFMSRRAIANMNTLYPNATAEELSSGDNVCIICREEMTTVAKKLPCNHIFHKACLRSWFQRQQTCPTCRLDVLRSPQAQTNVQQANNAAAAAAGAAAGARVANTPAPQATTTTATSTSENPTGVSGIPSSTTSSLPSFSFSGTHSMTGIPSMTSVSAGLPMNNFPAPPPFMPPPFMMPPFSFPVPMPQPKNGLSELSKEELNAMEGQERRNIEARIECLRNIQVLLDSAVVQLRDYMTIVNSLSQSNNFDLASLSSSSTSRSQPVSSKNHTRPYNDLSTVDSSTAHGSIPAAFTTKTPASSSISTNDISHPSNPVSSESETLDYSNLEGAVGYTPATVSNLDPIWSDSGSPSEHENMRRRRLEKFIASKSKASHKVSDDIELD